MEGEVNHNSKSPTAAAAGPAFRHGQPSSKRVRVLLAIVFVLGALGGCFLFSSTVCICVVPLFFIGQLNHVYREVIESLKMLQLSYIQSLLEILLGIKFVVTGDEIRSNETNLIIMNHRTRLDWMFFWGVLVRQSGIKSEKVVLKSILRSVPGVGWGMQLCAFIFIKRHLEDDKKIIDKMLKYYRDLKQKTQILLFPEGTDLTAHTKSVSDRFAHKNDWQTYEHVLHPRTSGFTFLMQSMRKYSSLEAVYDVTLAYPYSLAQNETDLVSGKYPQEVHFHVKRHPAANLPATEEGLAEWCHKRWTEKEETLRQFHKEKQFCDWENMPDRLLKEKQEKDARQKLWLIIIFWTLLILGIIVMLWYSCFVRWLVVTSVVFFTGMSYFGGFDTIQVDYYNRFLRGKRKTNNNED